MAVLILVFLGLLVIGAPIAVCMAGSTTLVLLLEDMSHFLVAQRMEYAIDSFTQLAIPFFILAGHFMNEGGISKRIVDFATSLIGHLKGGLAQAMIVASMLFAGISGSAYADASMLGTLMLPEMKEKGYPVADSTVILAAGATIGPIIPPSIQMVIFASTASVSVGQMLMGGVLPGIAMGVCLMAIVYFTAAKNNWPRCERASAAKIWKDFKGAVWALLMPLIVLGVIITGVCTATEAAVLAAAYSFIIGMFVYRELKFKNLMRIFINAFRQTAQVTIIIAAAGILGWYLTYTQLPATLSASLLGLTNSRIAILMIINVILLILGCFMETTAVVLLMTPVFLPVVTALGVSPIHFGVMMVLNLCIGLITPPVGMCMYIGCGISKCSIGDFCKRLPRYFIALLLALLLVTVCEPLVTWLPNLLIK